jgi:hypothetical protein
MRHSQPKTFPQQELRRRVGGFHDWSKQSIAAFFMLGVRLGVKVNQVAFHNPTLLCRSLFVNWE